MFKIKLYDIKYRKIFYKFFDTEFDRDKFIRKLKYSNRIVYLG